MNFCRSCQQALLLIDNCPCRNYKVWDVEHDEDEARTFYHCRSFSDAAESFVEDLGLTEDAEFVLMVKNFQGEIRKVTVEATIRLDLDSSVEEIEEASA